MKKNIQKTKRPRAKGLDCPNPSAGKSISHASSNWNGQCMDAHELEVLKESINQLRRRLHHLILQPECSQVSEEVLDASRALDKLVGDYQKALRGFKQLVQEQKRTY